ncbi:MAG TPA: PAS domain S-box protein, partial [Spirochaetia bacterium]|nr:PAS domain S-box protein [Spirochaetia bacterium]
VSGAFLLLAVGDMGSAITETTWRQTVFPSGADVVYMLAYPVFFSGVVVLSPPAGRTRERVRRLLDVALILLSALLALWVFVLTPLTQMTRPSSSLLDLITVQYLVGDVALLSALVALAFLRHSVAPAASRWFLMGSICAMVFADSAFALQNFKGIYTSGGPVDLGFVLGYGLAFFAGLCRLTEAGTPLSAQRAAAARRRLEAGRAFLPLAGISLVFAILVWSRFHPVALGDLALGCAAAVALLAALIRQAMETDDNRLLNRQLTESQRELDRRVSERTERLAAANRELLLLDRVRTALARELDSSAVLKTIVEVVASSLGYHMVSLYLREGDSLVLQHQVGYDEVIPRIPVSRGTAGRVARSGNGEIIRNAPGDPDFLFAVEGVQSEVVVPLVEHGLTIGILSVEDRRGSAFREEDRHLLTAVADHAVIALGRARLFDLVRESEERYRRLVETSPDAIVLTDPSLRILMANRQAEQLYGRSGDELSRQSVLQLTEAGDQERLRAVALEVLNSGGTMAVEVTVARPGRDPVNVDANASAVSDADGRRAGLLIVSRDITRRKRIEAELRSVREGLERKVEERTAALKESQERLRQSEKMEAIGQLAGGIAHDFNNLLLVIMGHSQALEGTELTPAQRRNVASILGSAERAASLTRQLLSFSRRQVMANVFLDLNTVIAGMAEMVTRLVGEHVRVEFHASDDLWPVLSDKVQIEQVVLNLATNAADAMPGGGILQIHTSNEELPGPRESRPEVIPPGRYTVLEVKDSGTGMTAEVREHAFEPFFTTKAEGKGTGLGLATVYGIVKQSRGFVALESGERGTTFRIYLPAHSEAPVETAPAPSQEPVRGGRESVLVVDDQDEVRRITAEMLRRLGYQVHEASSAREALSMAEKLAGGIDLVITDVSMPEVTGPALIREMERSGWHPRTIFISGFAKEEADRNLPDAIFL